MRYGPIKGKRMDSKLKHISKIISGEASVEEAQIYLESISREDLDKLITENNLSVPFENYQKRNDYQKMPQPAVSQNELDNIWKNIESEAKTTEKIPLSDIVMERVGDFLSRFKHLTMPSPKAYALAMSFFLVLFMSPFLMERTAPPEDITLDMKGENTTPRATIEYSIVNPDGRLARADRMLTPSDTLAFRLSFVNNGYGSLYIVYGDDIEKIIADHYFQTGTHDLDVGYKLNGNSGTNTLVVLYSESPLSLNEAEKEELLMEVAKNEVPAMVINNNPVHFTYESIKVE